jgi:hypothetical protein
MSEEYGLGDLLVAPFREDRCALFLRGEGRMLLEPPAVVMALLRSRRVDTLEGHARRLTAEFQMGANSTPALVEELGALVARGVLLSKAELLGPVGQPGPRVTVETVAIPSRARPQAVERCVRSFARSAQTTGRRLNIAVVDSGAGAPWTLEAAGCSVRVATPPDVERFARLVARAADVPEEVAHFALFDVHRLGEVDTGANRNALLLGLAGSAVLMTDDDTLAEVRRPDPAGAELVVSGSADPSRMTIYADEREAARAAPQPGVSLLERCEGLLGRRAGDIAADLPPERVRFEELRPELVRRLAARGATVRIVAPGIWGDSGVRFPGFYLWSRPDLQPTLTRDDPTYAALSRSRLMVRQVSTLTLTAPGFLMSTCLGLDNRGCLPPFVPVGRGQDLVFGTMLRQIASGLMVGHLPEAVTHAPVDGRGATVTELWDPATRLELAAVVDAVVALVSPGLELASSEAARLRLMGAHLQELAAQPWPEIDRLLRGELWQRLVRGVAQRESLARSRGADGPWLRDLERFHDHLLAQAERGGPALPDRLLAGRQMEEAAAVMRGFITDLGRLLGHWPALMDAARRLRQDGHGLFGPEG